MNPQYITFMFNISWKNVELWKFLQCLIWVMSHLGLFFLDCKWNDLWWVIMDVTRAMTCSHCFSMKQCHIRVQFSRYFDHPLLPDIVHWNSNISFVRRSMIYIFLVVGVTHHGLVAIPIWNVTKKWKEDRKLCEFMGYVYVSWNEGNEWRVLRFLYFKHDFWTTCRCTICGHGVANWNLIVLYRILRNPWWMHKCAKLIY